MSSPKQYTSIGRFQLQYPFRKPVCFPDADHLHSEGKALRSRAWEPGQYLNPKLSGKRRQVLFRDHIGPSYSFLCESLNSYVSVQFVTLDSIGHS